MTVLSITFLLAVVLLLFSLGIIASCHTNPQVINFFKEVTAQTRALEENVRGNVEKERVL